MKQAIQKELAAIWRGKDGSEIDETLAALGRLRAVATREDLPALLQALASAENNFWTRELLAEPVADLGGAEHIEELFDALRKNFADGHDNDGLQHFLVEVAESDPARCRYELKRLLADERSPHHEHARWLLEHCKEGNSQNQAAQATAPNVADPGR